MGFVGPMAFFMLFPPKQTVLPLPQNAVLRQTGQGAFGAEPQDLSSFSFLSYAFFSPSSATTFAQSFARSSMLSARAYSLSVWFHWPRTPQEQMVGIPAIVR